METISVESTFEQLVANLGKPERRTLNGREYLVSPITIFPPGGGVMNGSKGPLFYSDRVVGANLGGWNHIPIVARHPVAANGKHVSAADPDVLDKQRLGFLLNDRMEDGRRRVDGWHDVEATRNYDLKNGTRILNDLEAGELIEVSTGLLTDDAPAANGANHNGRAYTHEVRGWAPDHLAILPDQRGACAVADGCGVNNAETPERKGVLQKIMDGLRSLVSIADNAAGAEPEAANDLHDDAEYHCAECEGKPESEHCDKCKEMANNAFCPGEGARDNSCASGEERAAAEVKWMRSREGRQALANKQRVIKEMEQTIKEASHMGNLNEARDLQRELSKVKSKSTREFVENAICTDCKGTGFKGGVLNVTGVVADDQCGACAGTGVVKNAFCPGEGARDNSCSSEEGGSGRSEQRPGGSEQLAKKKMEKADKELSFLKEEFRKVEHLHPTDPARREAEDKVSEAKAKVARAVKKYVEEGQKTLASSGSRTSGLDGGKSISRTENIRSLNTGKFKAKGSGFGKGDMHEACQRGAMQLTARDHELGADAARQLAETGSNPASWVADEGTWEKAKAAADKGSYAKDSDQYWAVVSHIYKNMGGAVKDATDNEFDATVNAFCPTGEGGGVDPSCSRGGGGKGGKEPALGREYHDSVVSRIVDDAFGNGETSMNEDDLNAEEDNFYEASTEYAAEKMGKGFDPETASEEQMEKFYKHSDRFLTRVKKEIKRDVNKALKELGSIEYDDKDEETNNESGNPDDSTFNEGDSPMMTEKQRGVVVNELSTNCECWKGEADTLNEMSDEQLLKHAKAHQRAQADAVVANATREVFKPPADLKANEMPAFIKAKMKDEGDSEDEEDEEEEPMMADNSAVTANAAPQKPASFDEFLAAAPPEWREAVSNAVQITRQQKAGIVRRLVANVREERVRERLAAKYAKMPLGELQDMLALVPQQNSRPTANEGNYDNWLGAGGSMAANVLYSKEDAEADQASVDMMTPPTLNLADERKRRTA